MNLYTKTATIFDGDRSGLPSQATRVQRYPDADDVDIIMSTILSAFTYIKEVPIIVANEPNLFSKGFGYGSDFLFERVWIDPSEVDAGFIIENVQHDIKFWNSDRINLATTTAVNAVNQEGTLLTYPSLPSIIAAFGEAIYILDIYEDGPVIQDTTYTVTINGIDFDIDIDGIRSITYEMVYMIPNWAKGIDVKYSFKTTKFVADKLKEQRRPLSNSSWFSTNFGIESYADKARRVFNTISYGKDKVFSVPVFNEQIIPTSISQGSTTITTSKDLTELYCLNNKSTIIIIFDYVNNVTEAKAISSISANSIELETEILNDFQNTPVIYPVIFCYLKSFSGDLVTNDFDDMNIEFEEYKS